MNSELVTHAANPFEAFSRAVKMRLMTGRFLKFSKGDYTAGMDAELIAVGTKATVIMDSLQSGWIKWDGGRPVDERMVSISQGVPPVMRTQLGDIDKSKWQLDQNNELRDPWQLSNRVDMVIDGKGSFTFTTSSKGGLDAVGNLAGEYSRGMGDRPDQYPVVVLDVASYLHSNRALGRIKVPVFTIVGWVEGQPYRELLDGERGFAASVPALAETPASERMIPPAL
jgi:hypothetical protein